MLIGEQLNLGFALVTFFSVLNLPKGSAIGWIGHAIEQYQTAQIIRPRARYIGE